MTSSAIAAATMPVANTSTSASAAVTSTANTDTTSSTGAVDFLAILGQLTATAAPTPATTAMQLTTALPEAVAKELEDLDTEEPDPSELLGMMSLPGMAVIPQEIQLQSGGGGQSRSDALSAAVDLASSSGDAIAPEAQLLTDLIQPDQASTQGKFDLTQLQAPAADPSATSEADVNAAYSRPVHQSVGSAAWNDEIGSRLTMMVESGKHTASLKLSPEHLGPLEVQITMSDDQASVWFGATNADTRTAIENALPRLREMFASQGLSLTDANVSREPPRQQQQSNNTSQSSSSGEMFGGEDGVVTATAVQIKLGLLDAYA